MLEDILDNASIKLETTKNAENRLRDTERFTKNMTKVLESAGMLDLYLDTVATAEANQLMNVSIESIIRNDIIASLKTVLSQLHEGYLELEPVSSIRKNITDFKKHLDSLWINSVKTCAEQVISLLKNFGQFMPNENEAAKIVSTLEKNITSFPVGSDDIIIYKSDLQKGREMADQIGADDDIQLFIRKVCDSRATLEDITPEVQAWIHEHGLEKRMRIRLL